MTLSLMLYLSIFYCIIVCDRFGNCAITSKIKSTNDFVTALRNSKFNEFFHDSICFLYFIIRFIESFSKVVRNCIFWLPILLTRSIPHLIISFLLTLFCLAYRQLLILLRRHRHLRLPFWLRP